MLKVFGVAAAGLAFGALLAWPWVNWPVRPGWIGGALLVMAAIAVRRHWNRRRVIGDDPGARERRSWHALAGLAVICGHLIASLAQGVDLHVGGENTLALDNWTLIGGAAAAWLIVRAPVMEKDARDREMANRGVRVGYGTLIGLVVVLLLTLGFAPPHMAGRLEPFVLGNVLVVVVLLAVMADQATRLIGYWSAALPGEEADG